MAREARPATVTRRDYTGAVGTAAVDVTVRSYGVEVIDDQVVVTIGGGGDGDRQGGSGDE
jgi:hypothetical protein